MLSANMHFLYDGQGSRYDDYTAVTKFARVPHRLATIFQEKTGALCAGLHVMDFGCGTGRLTQNLLQIEPNLHITAVEPCDSMSIQYRMKFGSNKNCTLIRDGYKGEGDSLLKTQNDENYDLVISSGVFDHIPITPKVMQDFMNAVKPNGYLAFSYELHSPLWGKNQMSWTGGRYYSHRSSYVKNCIESAGAKVILQDQMLSYIHRPLPAICNPQHSIVRAGLVIAQK